MSRALAREELTASLLSGPRRSKARLASSIALSLSGNPRRTAWIQVKMLTELVRAEAVWPSLEVVIARFSRSRHVLGFQPCADQRIPLFLIFLVRDERDQLQALVAVFGRRSRRRK
jgi:hypothetical protein